MPCQRARIRRASGLFRTGHRPLRPLAPYPTSSAALHPATALPATSTCITAPHFWPLIEPLLRTPRSPRLPILVCASSDRPADVSPLLTRVCLTDCSIQRTCSSDLSVNTARCHELIYLSRPVLSCSWPAYPPRCSLTARTPRRPVWPLQPTWHGPMGQRSQNTWYQSEYERCSAHGRPRKAAISVCNVIARDSSRPIWEWIGGGKVEPKDGSRKSRVASCRAEPPNPARFQLSDATSRSDTVTAMTAVTA